MIHVYAVTDRPDAAIRECGIESASVEVLPADGFGVAVSRHERSDMPPATDAVLAHARVCDALLATESAVLPVRFGARYETDDDVRAAIAEQHSMFAAALRHVRGRVEIGVRVAWTHGETEDPAAVESVPSPTGTLYLQQRLAEERHRASRQEAAAVIADELHQRLAQAAVDSRTQVLPSPGLVLSAAYLVAHDGVDEFTRVVAHLSETRTDVQILCTGPWPPYHFAGKGALG